MEKWKCVAEIADIRRQQPESIEFTRREAKDESRVIQPIDIMDIFVVGTGDREHHFDGIQETK